MKGAGFSPLADVLVCVADIVRGVVAIEVFHQSSSSSIELSIGWAELYEFRAESAKKATIPDITKLTPNASSLNASCFQIVFLAFVVLSYK